MKAQRVETDDPPFKRYAACISASIPLVITGIIKWCLTAQAPSLSQVSKRKQDGDVPLFEHQLLQRRVLESVKMYDVHAVRYNLALETYPVLRELGLERMDESRAFQGGNEGVQQEEKEKKNPYMMV